MGGSSLRPVYSWMPSRRRDSPSSPLIQGTLQADISGCGSGDSMEGQHIPLSQLKRTARVPRYCSRVIFGSANKPPRSRPDTHPSHAPRASRFARFPVRDLAAGRVCRRGRDLLVTVGGQNLALRGSPRGLKPQGVRRVRGYCWTFIACVACVLHLRETENGHRDGRPSTPLPPPYRRVSPLPFPSESTLSYHGPFPID